MIIITLFVARFVPNLTHEIPFCLVMSFKHDSIKSLISPLLSGPRYSKFPLYFPCSRTGVSCFLRSPGLLFFLINESPHRLSRENMPTSFFVISCRMGLPERSFVIYGSLSEGDVWSDDGQEKWR